MDYSFWITMGTAAILASIKSEESRLRFKKIMLKIYRSIGDAYMGDPDFHPGTNVITGNRVTGTTGPISPST